MDPELNETGRQQVAVVCCIYFVEIMAWDYNLMIWVTLILFKS